MRKNRKSKKAGTDSSFQFKAKNWNCGAPAGEIKEIGFGAPGTVISTIKFFEPVTILATDSLAERNEKISAAIESAGGFK